MRSLLWTLLWLALSGTVVVVAETNAERFRRGLPPAPPATFTKHPGFNNRYLPTKTVKRKAIGQTVYATFHLFGSYHINSSPAERFRKGLPPATPATFSQRAEFNNRFLPARTKKRAKQAIRPRASAARRALVERAQPSARALVARVPGPSQRARRDSVDPSGPISGLLGVYSDAARTAASFQGFVNAEDDDGVVDKCSVPFGFALTKDHTRALEVSARIGAGQNLATSNEPNGNPFVGGNAARGTVQSDDLVPGKGGFIILAGATATEPGYPAEMGGAFSYPHAYGYKAVQESAIWTVGEEGELDIVWVNPDGTKTNAVAFVDAGYGWGLQWTYSIADYQAFRSGKDDNSSPQLLVFEDEASTLTVTNAVIDVGDYKPDGRLTNRDLGEKGC
ncbi:hypothetical protein MNV49_001233 [Pseudohyphozyma bogoriensis]|nr:hypothetical protein MNV49_001233 [Pseudohyphozyma bogoriensis]